MTDLFESPPPNPYIYDDIHDELALSSLVGMEMESYQQNNFDTLNLGFSNSYNGIYSGPSSPTSKFLIDRAYDSNTNENEDPLPRFCPEQLDNSIEAGCHPLSDNSSLSDMLYLTYPPPLSGLQFSTAPCSISDLSLCSMHDSDNCSPTNLDNNMMECNTGMTPQPSQSPRSVHCCTPSCELQEGDLMSSNPQSIHFNRVVLMCPLKSHCCGILMYDRLRKDLGY